ncbi:acetone carboxylase subunit gamma [Gordonia terrae]
MTHRERITEHIDLDVDTERWTCRRCDHDLGPADRGYKYGLRVRERDPSVIHRPLIDPTKYQYTFAPNPNWCRMIEYFCPGCAVMVEVQYLPPGFPVSHDSFDIEWFRAQARDRRDQQALETRGES